jgi:hypothetical protein
LSCNFAARALASGGALLIDIDDLRSNRDFRFKKLLPAIREQVIE